MALKVEAVKNAGSLNAVQTGLHEVGFFVLYIHKCSSFQVAGCIICVLNSLSL